MKERPLLFSAPMVRAARREVDPKTQTRRLVKGLALDWLAPDGFTPEYVADPGNRFSPYGYPGDRLWVRETFRLDAAYDRRKPSDVSSKASVWFEADGEILGGGVRGKTRVSIHMPRWACRTLLEVVAVRIERLHDCSEADALAEGITCENVIVGANCNGGVHSEETADRYFWEGGDDEGYETAVDAYRALWEHINKPGSWDANPWVWIIEFRRVP